MTILNQLTTTETVKLYNIFAAQNGSATVKKFSDKTIARKRIQDITRGKDRRIVVAAMKEVGIKAEIIKQLPDVPVEVVVGEVTATVTATKPQLEKKVSAKPILEEANKKESFRQAKVDKKQAASIRKEVRMTDHAAEVLRAIRTECGTNKDTEVSTTDLMKNLDTSWNAVSKAVESLAKLNLIKIEDDSPDDDHPLWYISLTKDGREVNIPEAKVKATSAGKPKKSLPNPNPGVRSSKAGKKIHKLVEGNPRREGTHGHKSFAIIKNGMTYEDYMSSGGRNNDLAWDIDHGFVELR